MAIDPTAPVTAIINGAMNVKQAREEQKRAHGYNKEYMALSHMYEMASARKSAQMTKEGLIAAGLSPALMSQGLFAPATAPTGPSAPTPAPSRFDMKSLGIGDMFQLQNLKAQTDNLNADTESKKIKNEQEQNANEISKLFSDVYFDKLKQSAHSPEELAKYEELKSIAKNKGAFGLFDAYLNILDKKELYDMDYQEYMLRKNIAFWQNANEETFLDIAKVPTRNRQLLERTIHKYSAEIEKLRKDSKLTDEERNLKLQQIELTKEEIENLRETTKNLKNTNIMKMIDDGEYGKAFIATILMLFGQVSASKRL